MESPDLRTWARNVRRAIDMARGRVWLIAHSFGCLDSVRAAADRLDRIAGAMLVAPVDPFKFRAAGLLRVGPFPFPSVVVASANDPWMRLTSAAYWSEQWGSRLLNLGVADYINVDAGFRPLAGRAGNLPSAAGGGEGRAKDW